MPAGPQRRLERGHRHAGFDGRRQIARLVLDQLTQAFQVQDDSRLRSRYADGGGGAPTPGHDRDSRAGRDLDDGPHLVHRAGNERGFGSASLDDVRRELHGAEDVGGADDGPELVENRDVHGRSSRPR